MWAEVLSVEEIGLVLLAALTIAWVALALVARAPISARKPRQPEPDRHEVAFLFRGSDLVDCTPAARRLMDVTDQAESDLLRLTRFLAPRFPDLMEKLGSQETPSPAELVSVDGTSRLLLAPDGALRRLKLEDTTEGAQFYAPDRHSIAALFEELQSNRLLMNSMPFPMWRQTTEGEILWVNEEYRRLLGRTDTQHDPAQRPPRLLSEPPDMLGDTRRVQRVKLELPHEAEPKWFEYQTTQMGGDLLVAALPVDRVVRAERSLQSFLQTLTQTFAHLNVGLAVFSRNRELVVFNPALNDLLDLSPEFLTNRPKLTQVFDRLREQRMVPEQKDYKAWRLKLSALEAAAADSTHSETWSLTDGRTLRVTGRPHPEGAVAFLFEDISDGIKLERRFRADLQLGQSVIDGVEEALAVFTPSGALALSNRAYRDLWYAEQPPEATTDGIVASTKRWQKLCRPTPIWGDVRDFAATISDRAQWDSEARMRDGRRLRCRFEPLAGGNTLVGFTVEAEHVATKETVADDGGSKRQISA